MEQKRVLIAGASHLTIGERAWAEVEINNILSRFISEGFQVFVYSSLQRGTPLLGAHSAILLNIPVIACMAIDVPDQKFCREELAFYREIRRKTFNMHIIGRTLSYETFKKRDLYLAHQTNSAIYVWNKEKDTPDHYFYTTLTSNCCKDYHIYHLDQKQKIHTNFKL